MKVDVYLQVEPVWSRWNPNPDKPRLDSLRIVAHTKTRPRRPRGGTVVVKLRLDIADAAFLPISPEVEIEIPAVHTDAVQKATSEPVEVPA